MSAAQAGVLVLLTLGLIGTYGARTWQISQAITSEEIARIPIRLRGLPLRPADGALQGTPVVLDSDVVDLSGADYYAAVNYRSLDGSVVRLHVGVSTQSEGWLHEPTVCLPSHGWTTTRRARVPIWEGLPGASPECLVWRMELEKADERLLVYYWLQWGDHVVTSRLERAWARFRCLLAGQGDRPMQIVILYTKLDQPIDRSERLVRTVVQAVWPSLTESNERGD